MEDERGRRGDDDEVTKRERGRERDIGEKEEKEEDKRGEEKIVKRVPTIMIIMIRNERITNDH